MGSFLIPYDRGEFFLLGSSAGDRVQRKIVVMVGADSGGSKSAEIAG